MEKENYPSWPGWETVRLIGRGSFGAVYEIRRDMFGEQEKAALKVISIPQNDSDISEMRSDGYDDESITSTFREHLKSIVAEYTLMRKLNGSANVVNCDDVRYVEHEDGLGWDVFIKMELLTALPEILPDQIPEAQVIKAARDLCRALVQCRQFDIVHRDIKPQNIFVSPLGDYKLGDFGIAKTIERTTGGTKIGTYKYMAPEVYNNQPYGAGADIYSLGLVLYWLLNERRMPFLPLPPEKLRAGLEEQARLRRFAGEPIPAPAHGSRELQRIVLKACAYDPRDRYQSADEMLADLDALYEPTPASEPHPSEANGVPPADPPFMGQSGDDDFTKGAVLPGPAPHASSTNADAMRPAEPLFTGNVREDDQTVGVFANKPPADADQKRDEEEKAAYYARLAGSIAAAAQNRTEETASRPSTGPKPAEQKKEKKSGPPKPAAANQTGQPTRVVHYGRIVGVVAMAAVAVILYRSGHENFALLLGFVTLVVAFIDDFFVDYVYPAGKANLTWTLDDSGLLTLNGTGWMGGYQNGSYDRTAVRKVIIQKGLTTIGHYAFEGSELTDVTIPDGVISIGFCAFADCAKLKSIEIPKSVNAIMPDAFRNCNNLTDIRFLGSEQEWKAIDKGTDSCLSNARIHFNQ